MLPTRHILLLCLLLVMPPVPAAPAWQSVDPLGVLPGTTAPACSAADALTPLTLDTVIATTLCHSPAIRGAAARARAQGAQAGVAHSASLPGLAADLRYSQNQVGNATGSSAFVSRSGEFTQGSATLSLSYLLYDFGGRAARQTQADSLLEASLASQNQIVQQSLFDAIQAYYRLRAEEAAIAAARKAETASQASLEAAETQRKVGTATMADVLQARTAHSQAALTRIRAEGEHLQLRGQLAQAMGLRANTPVQLAPEPTNTDVPPAFSSSVEDLLEQAQATRPSLRAARAQFEAADANLRNASANRMPTLNLAASHTQTDTQGLGNSDNTAAGINISIPLFTGFATTYRIRAAEAERDVAAATLNAEQQQSDLDVWTAYHRLATARQARERSRELVTSAQESAAVALGRYQAGVGNVLDVLNAQSALATAEQQVVAARYDLDQARTALAFALGRLSPDDGTAPVTSFPPPTAPPAALP